jgi:hypothetical protein
MARFAHVLPTAKFSLVRDTLKYLALSGKEAGALPCLSRPNFRGNLDFQRPPVKPWSLCWLHVQELIVHADEVLTFDENCKCVAL